MGLASVRWRWLRSLLALPFVLLFAFDLIVAQNPDYQHDDARGMVQYYADHLSSADSVIAWSYADRYDLAYYWDRLGVKAKRITLPEGADLDAVADALPTSGDVALNVWYTQRADYRGMMGCVLGNGTVDEPESFTTYGMTSLIYHQPSLDLPELRANRSCLRRQRRDSGGAGRCGSDKSLLRALIRRCVCLFRSRCCSLSTPI